MNQAPKGGMTVAGVFYKGGQFLPTVEPQRGKFNRPATKKQTVRKVQIAQREYAEAPEGKRSIWQMVAGSVASIRDEKLFFCGNERSLAYIGMTETKANELISKWNEGQRWV